MITSLVKILVFVTLFVLSACSVQHVATHNYPVSNFKYRHLDFDYKAAWNTTQTDHQVIFDGILKNIRYAFIDDLDLTIFLLAPDGNVRARTTSIPVLRQSRKNDVIPFHAELKNVVLNRGETLMFVIHYQGSDSGRDGIDWHSAFAVDAMTGESRRQKNVEPEEW